MECAKCVEVWVKPGREDEFLAATKANRNATLQEAGCFKFHILKDGANPSHFFLFEAFYSLEAAKRHKSTGHYLSWKLAVESLMARPRNSRIIGLVAGYDLLGRELCSWAEIL